ALVGGLEEVDEEPADGGLVALAAHGLGLGHEPPQLVATGVRDRPGPAAPGALADDLDHPLVLELGQLRIDLAVARVPGVGERLVEALGELVAGGRLDGEQAEDGVAERHRGSQDTSELTYRVQ